MLRKSPLSPLRAALDKTDFCRGITLPKTGNRIFYPLSRFRLIHYTAKPAIRWLAAPELPRLFQRTGLVERLSRKIGAVNDIILLFRFRTLKALQQAAFRGVNFYRLPQNKKQFTDTEKNERMRLEKILIIWYAYYNMKNKGAT